MVKDARNVVHGKESCKCQVEFDLGRSYIYQNDPATEVWLAWHDVRSCPIDAGIWMAEINDPFAGWFSSCCHILLSLSSGKRMFILQHWPLEIHTFVFDFAESHNWEETNIGIVKTVENLDTGPRELWNGHETLETESRMARLRYGMLSSPCCNHLVGGMWNLYRMELAGGGELLGIDLWKFPLRSWFWHASDAQWPAMIWRVFPTCSHHHEHFHAFRTRFDWNPLKL